MVAPREGDGGPGTAGTAGCRSGEGGCPWEATQASVPSLPPGDLVCGLGSQAPSSASSRLSAGGGVGGEVSVLRGRAGTNVAGGRRGPAVPGLGGRGARPVQESLAAGQGGGAADPTGANGPLSVFSALGPQGFSDSVPAWLDLLPEMFLILQTIELVKNGHRGSAPSSGVVPLPGVLTGSKHAFLKPHQFDCSESPQLLPHRDSCIPLHGTS